MNLLEETAALAAITEVGTIASGNAATALSKLIGHEVLVAVPTVRLTTVEKLSASLGPTNQVATAILVRIEGDVQGLLLFSLSPADAEAVSGKIAQQQTTTTFIDIDQSVLKEMVNIIAGAVLTAVSKFLDIRLHPSVPASATDMLGAVVDPFVAELGAQFEQVLLQQELFTIPSKGVSLHFSAIIDPPSTTTLLAKLSLKMAGTHAASN